MTADISSALSANPYPGRVLVLARTWDGELSGVYAVTGRSPSSKARRIAHAPDNGLVVAATGDHRHDTLRHYTAARRSEAWYVVGNGTQVDPVFARLAAGAVPAVALDDLAYEPDPPIHTPRITVVIDRNNGAAWFGAARRSAGARETADVTVTVVRNPAPGDAVLLSTYESDGERVDVARRHLDVRTTAPDGARLLDDVWHALDARFAVAAAGFSPLGTSPAVLRHA